MTQKHLNFDKTRQPVLSFGRVSAMMLLLNYLKRSALLALPLFALCGSAVAEGNDSPKVSKSQTKAPQASPKPLYNDWNLVNQSDFIVKGQLIVPIKAIQNSIRSEKYDYVKLKLFVHRVLKGKSSRKVLSVNYYTHPVPYSPSSETLVSLHKKEVIAFLLQTDEYGPRLYFAGYSPKALQPFNKSLAAQIHSEAINQNSILTNFKKSAAAQPDQYHAKVKALIAAMLNAKTEDKAFEQLIALGPAAVPSTIRLMDDRRPLPIRGLSLPSDGFESRIFYGPEVLVDALSTIAGHVVGDSYGQITSGGSERERRAVVNAWRVYLHYQLGQGKTFSNKAAQLY